MTAIEIFKTAFSVLRDPRSPAYKRGVIDALMCRFKKVPGIVCPYDPGSAEADAYHAGICEGHRLACEHAPVSDLSVRQPAYAENSGGGLRIEDDTIRWIELSLGALRDEAAPYASVLCHTCGANIKFPLIARRSDVEEFQLLVAAANDVMRRNGITAHLLAEVFAACVLAKAKNGSQSVK